MPRSIYEEGRQAYGVVDPRKCPYQTQATRDAWFKGYDDAKREAERD